MCQKVRSFEVMLDWALEARHASTAQGVHRRRGGLYYVYDRFASGEVFSSDLGEAKDLVELLRQVKKRDVWTVFAWSLMSDHLHLAIRSRVVPLSHGLRCLQLRTWYRWGKTQ